MYEVAADEVACMSMRLRACGRGGMHADEVAVDEVVCRPLFKAASVGEWGGWLGVRGPPPTLKKSPLLKNAEENSVDEAVCMWMRRCVCV